MQIFDAVGLGLFAVVGAGKTLAFHLRTSGGGMVVVLGNMLNLPSSTVSPVGAALCCGIRLLAIRYRWQLPMAPGVQSGK